MDSTEQQAADRSHFPRYPGGWVGVHLSQFWFCIATTSASAYFVSLFDDVDSRILFSMSIVTIAVTIWQLIAHTCWPKCYKYWVILLSNFVLGISWCCCFLEFASRANKWRAAEINSTAPEGHPQLTSILIAVASFCAILCALFLISSVTDAIVILAHRRAGLHLTRPSSAAV